MLVEQLKIYCKKKGVSFAEFERESGGGERTVHRKTCCPTLHSCSYPSPDYSAIQKITLSNANIRESYYTLSKPERRAFWRAVIEKLEARGDVVDVTWRQE